MKIYTADTEVSLYFLIKRSDSDVLSKWINFRLKFLSFLGGGLVIMSSETGFKSIFVDSSERYPELSVGTKFDR